MGDGHINLRTGVRPEIIRNLLDDVVHTLPDNIVTNAADFFQKKPRLKENAISFPRGQLVGLSHSDLFINLV